MSRVTTALQVAFDVGRRPLARKEMVVHIQKTAGTSLRRLMAQQYPGHRCVFVYSLDPEPLEVVKRRAMRADAVYGHFTYGFHEVLGVEARYHTILREPTARVVSAYRHSLQRDDNPFHERLQAGMSLLELIESEEDHLMNNHMTRVIAGHQPTDTVTDRWMLDQALRNIDEHFDVVGITERMDDSVALLGHELGWTDLPPVGRHNENPDAQQVDLDVATLAAIRRYNALDDELYAVMAERFAARVAAG